MRAWTFVVVLAAMLSGGWPGAAWSSDYSVSVTRKGSNLYKVDGQDVLIKTRFCYEYVYSEDAVLKSSGYGGELIFIDEEEECDVEAVYGKATLSPGRYRITVSHSEDDWYEVMESGSYIQTSLCLSLALGTQAILTIRPGGYGRMLFDDEQGCDVEGVYNRLRLN